MRIRSKPWAKPELDACGFCIDTPEALKGEWQKEFGNGKPIYLELGCGKGGFISKAASANQSKNFIAVDIKNEMLVLAKRKIEAEYQQKNLPLDNVRIFIKNIEQIDNIFSREDRIERIYINFCNPWPKSKHKKRRLTHYRQLVKYREFLSGELWFKTDDDALFRESFEYFEQAGYRIKYKTYDLHKSGFEENTVTEHEQMFTAQGKKIKFLIAELKSEDSKEGEPMNNSARELTVDGITADKENTFRGIGISADSDSLNSLMDYKIKYPESYNDIMDLLFKPYYGAGITHIKAESKEGAAFSTDAGKINSDISAEISNKIDAVNDSVMDITGNIIKNNSQADIEPEFYALEQLVRAEQPWSGYYEAAEGLWGAAHITHFVGPDWRFVKSFGTGNNDEIHAAFMSDSGDYTLVFQNNTDSEALYNINVLNTGKADSVLYCIESVKNQENGSYEWFRVIDKIIPAGNKNGCFYRIDVKAHSILTCTTMGVEDVDGINSVKKSQFNSARLELPYTDSFNYSDEFLMTRNKNPMYTAGMNGKFEIRKYEDENILEHVQESSGSGAAVLCIGDRYWSNCSARADVMLGDCCDGSYAGIGLRCMKDENGVYINGCELRLYSDGKWQLRCIDDVAAEGTDGEIDACEWNQLKISVKRDVVICSINKQIICNYKMSEPLNVSGFVSFNSSEHRTGFRKLSVNAVPGMPCFCVYRDALDSSVRYGDGWLKGRDSVYTDLKGAVLELEFCGESFALIGSAEGLRLKAEIDDRISTAGFSVEKSSSCQAFYYGTGLSEGNHKLRLTVLSGKLSLSGFAFDEKKHSAGKKAGRAGRRRKTEPPKGSIKKSTLLLGAGLAAAGAGAFIISRLFGKNKK